MAWSRITASDVKTRLSGPELTALSGQALSTGQVDPLTDVIQQVVDEIRGYIAAAPRNHLGHAGTIPSQLRSAALAMVRWRLGGRLSASQAVAIFQTDARRKEYEDAITHLRDVANSRVAIEKPETVGLDKFPIHPGSWGSNTKLTT